MVEAGKEQGSFLEMGEHAGVERFRRAVIGIFLEIVLA